MIGIKEQIIDLKGFKTVNTYFRPYNIPQDHLAFALNVNFSEDGKIIQRPGTRVIQQFSYQPNIFVSRFIDSAVIVENLWCVANDTLYRHNDTTGVFDVINSTLDAATVWGGITYLTKFIFGNGLKNYIYDYVAGTVSEAIIGNNPKAGHTSTGSLFEIFAQRVFVAGDGTENLYYSEIGDPTETVTGESVGTGDGTTTDFYLSKYPVLGGSETIYVAGTAQTRGTDYTIDYYTGKISFVTAPASGAAITADYTHTTWEIDNFIAFSGRINAIKAVADILFVGTDNGLYKVIQTGDATVPFKVDKLMPYGIIPNGLFPIKGTMVGALTDEGKLVAFDPYIQSGSQADDSLGLVVYNVLKNIDTTAKFSIKQVFNEIYFTGAFNETYIESLGIKTAVLNTNTFGWSFYDKNVFDAVVYKGEVYFAGQNYVRKFDEDFFQDEIIDPTLGTVGQDFETYIITPIFGGDYPEYRKNWRRLDITTASKTKTELTISYAVNLSQTFRDADITSFYAADARLGYAVLGSFNLGGSWAQAGRVGLNVNSNGLMLKIQRTSSNSDFQIGRLKLSYFLSYRQ